MLALLPSNQSTESVPDRRITPEGVCAVYCAAFCWFFGVGLLGPGGHGSAGLNFCAVNWILVF